jgi:hypothetical protein
VFACIVILLASALLRHSGCVKRGYLVQPHRLVRGRRVIKSISLSVSLYDSQRPPLSTKRNGTITSEKYCATAELRALKC